MRLFYCFLALTLASCSPSDNSSNTLENTTDFSAEGEVIDLREKGFDAAKAEEYGADEYGMKPYVMAFLKTGPNEPKDSIHALELQAAHMANINRLANEGKLVVAGPFYGDNKGDFRGIYIFDTASLDSARRYTETDPAIVYGSLKMELIQWYGSAALKAVKDIHHEIAKTEI